MAKTYRLDIRYRPEDGVNSVRRVRQLAEALSGDGFEVSDVSLFDDGMRASVLVHAETPAPHDVQLLGLVSGTGSIGRFSCREAEAVAVRAAAQAIESESALV